MNPRFSVAYGVMLFTDIVRWIVELPASPNHAQLGALVSIWLLGALLMGKQFPLQALKRANESAILLSFIGRLAEQKGVRLLTDWVGERTVLEEILERFPGVQILIGGPASEGDAAVARLGEIVETLAQSYPGRIRGVFDFIPHREALIVTQASDLFLMPSRYEPGGITQLEALAAGTPVVARNVGGIRATLENFADGKGNSFLFREYTGSALLQALERGIETMQDERARDGIIAQAAYAKNDWSDRTAKYVALFHFVAGVTPEQFPFLADEREILLSIRPV